MVQSLEEYIAQSTNAYKPSTTAVQNQLDALAGKLEATNEAINKNYAQQQARLDLNKNQAAETASMQAAGSGGSFGGAANLANRKYYEQSFIPAVTQMRTNQSNDLASARQASDSARENLNTQLANIQAQSNQQGLAQYYSDTNAELQRQYQAEQARLEREYQAQQAELARQFQIAEAEKERQFQAEQAEKNRAAQRAAAAASANATNAYIQRAMQSQGQSQSPAYKNWDFGNGYSIQELPNGQAAYYRNGRALSAGQFLEGTGASGANWNLWNDVWSNGVSTNGVGSDTVEAFNRRTPQGSNYGYLYG